MGMTARPSASMPLSEAIPYVLDQIDQNDTVIAVAVPFSDNRGTPATRRFFKKQYNARPHSKANAIVRGIAHIRQKQVQSSFQLVRRCRVLNDETVNSAVQAILIGKQNRPLTPISDFPSEVACH